MKEVRLEINAGAGGAESQAWAAMVLHMYVRWCARKGLSIAPGREITKAEHGIESAALTIKGDDAERLLTEDGIHRMVRHSPFDAEGRRHTSFASVSVNSTVEGHIVAPRRRRSWGGLGAGQIRSYVLSPYKLAKDLRTGHEEKDVDAVLDGTIDEFLTLAAAQEAARRDNPNDRAAAVPDCA